MIREAPEVFKKMEHPEEAPEPTESTPTKATGFEQEDTSELSTAKEFQGFEQISPAEIISAELEEKHIKPLRDRLKKIKYSPFHFDERAELKAKITEIHAALQKIPETVKKLEESFGKPLKPEDLEALYQMHAHPEYMEIRRYFNQYLVTSNKQNLQTLQKVLSYYRLPEVSKLMYRHWARVSSQAAAEQKKTTDAVKKRKTTEEVIRDRVEARQLGKAVRKKTVSAKKIQAGLKQHLKNLQIERPITVDEDSDDKDPASQTVSLSEKEQETLSKVMAREIVEKYGDGKDFNGNGKRISLTNTQYRFFDIDAGKTEILKSPYDFWVKNTEKGIEFQLIEKTLGQGSFNTVFQTQKFEIPLQDEEHAPDSMQVTGTVPLRRADMTTEKQKKTIEKAQAAHKLVREKFTQTQRDELGFDLPTEETMNRTTPGGRGEKFLETDGTEVYPNDYNKAHLTMTEDQRLRVLGDTAVALNALHQQERVHGDVKPGNIAVGKDGRTHLLDFDMASLNNAKKREGTLLYIDALLWGNRKTELTDIYATAVMTLQTSKNPELRKKAEAVIQSNYKIAQAIDSELVETIKEFLSKYKIKVTIPKNDNQQTQKNYLRMPIDQIHREFPAYKEFMNAAMKYSQKATSNPLTSPKS